eukprot:306323-Chlamydomonas_euryale.AAC.1
MPRTLRPAPHAPCQVMVCVAEVDRAVAAVTASARAASVARAAADALEEDALRSARDRRIARLKA